MAPAGGGRVRLWSQRYLRAPSPADACANAFSYGRHDTVPCPVQMAALWLPTYATTVMPPMDPDIFAAAGLTALNIALAIPASLIPAKKTDDLFKTLGVYSYTCECSRVSVLID